MVCESNIYQGPFLCQPVRWSRVIQWSAEVSGWVLEVRVCFPHFLKATRISGQELSFGAKLPALLVPSPVPPQLHELGYVL